MVKIRVAERSDVDWVLGELLKFSKFYGTKKNLFGDHKYATQVVLDVIQNHLFLISEIDGIRSGLIAGYVTNHPFNPGITVLQELWWWVCEDHRGTRSGYKLFKEFTEYGETYCDWTLFTLEDESPVSDKLLYRNGFRLKETTYLKESEWER